MKNQFPFTLKEIFIPNILFRLNPAFKSKEGKIGINTSIEVEFLHKGKDLSVQVRVELPDGENTPFSFAVDAVGRFIFKEEPPAEELGKIARVNCAAMIFPYLRETIADLTRRAGVPPLHLQPVNFVAMMKTDRAENTTETEQKKQVAKKKKLTGQ